MDARDTPHLPEEILAVIISLTSPHDACRFAIVSRAFHAAADSDAVWSCFLPGNLPPSVDVGELKEPSSKKEQFMRLSDEPALLLDGLITSTWLDRATGGKCYALPARALDIWLGDDPNSWRWVHADVFHDIKTGERISAEVAQLLSVDRLEIRGKIPGKMLSPNSIYAAYIVFKLTDGGGYGLDYPFLETSVSFGGSISTREACLHGYDEDGVDGVITPKQVDILQQIYGTRGDDRQMSLIQDGVLLPWERADGWMELELGWFYNKGDGGDEVHAALKETTFLHSKSGLIVRSIEIRIFFF